MSSGMFIISLVLESEEIPGRLNYLLWIKDLLDSLRRDPILYPLSKEKVDILDMYPSS